MPSSIPRPTVIAAILAGLTTLTLSGLMLPAVWYEVFHRQDVGYLILALGGVGAMLALVTWLVWLNLMRRTTPGHRLGLAALTLICWAMPLLLGISQGWGNALLAPAGLIAVVLPLREAIVATAAATVLTPVYGGILGLSPMALLYEVLGIPIGAFSGYITVWLFHVVQELREARAELARSAVGEERLRFARDLHDVLGHSLQAVALRAEVAERFLERDDGRVRKELTEIQTIARDAVRDVREVVRGYRATSLSTELDGMSAVLRAAGIRCERPETPPSLPAHVHEPLGRVAREAATNVLRHSSATWCDITVEADAGRVRVEIVNDGAPRRTTGDDGSGLTGLAERIAAAGGEFTAGPAGGGTFWVTAVVPAVPVPAGPVPAGPVPAGGEA